MAPASPPAWLLAALAAPHAWALLPLLVPRWLATVAAAAGHPDAAVPYAAGALVLAAMQAGAVLEWLVEARAAGTAIALAGSGAAVAARAALAAPLLAAGAWLKLGAARVLGRGGLCFGRQLGGRERNQPLVTAWPFSVTAHPDYVGAAVMLLGAGVLLLGGPDAPPGGVAVLLFWLALYAASAVAEEGLCFAGASPQPPLRPGANPFWDYMSRPLNAAERVRLWLMAPIAFLRCCIFWSSIPIYGVVVNAISRATHGDDRRRHALLVPVTQRFACTVLWCCGYTLSVRGRANLEAAQRAAAAANASFCIVSNHLSYMDIVVCAAVFGPFAAAARHDLLDWPIVGPVARAWGTVGVVQSDIREKELAEAAGADAPAELAAAAPAPAAAPPGGRAAALAARAALPGAGWALPPVLVYPEGTTTAGGCLITFRKGAFVGGVPVLPVTLRYSSPSGFNLAWGMPHTTGSHFWRGMCCWGKRADVDILPLHTPTAAQCADAMLFGDAVRATMAASLGWPALTGWGVREGHALGHEAAHGGGPLCRAAIAAGEASAEEAPPVPQSGPSAALPPLPPPSPSQGAALAARHRGGSGGELSAAVPPRLSAATVGRRCPSPRQAPKEA